MPARISTLSFTEIKKLYFDEHLTFEEIGKRLGASRQTIINRFRERGLTPRPHGTMRVLIPREELETLYIDQRLSVKEVAKRLNSTPWKVAAACRRYGIKVRRAGGRVKYPELGKLQIGESTIVPRPKTKGKWQSLYYAHAKTHGIMLSVRTIDDETVRLIRVG